LTQSIDYKLIHKDAWDGLDLMMEHFRYVNGNRLPRTIQTGAGGKGTQYSVDSRERIMTYYKAALYEDCRINAYPDFETMKQQSLIPKDYKPMPDYVLIDLDRKSFDSDEAFESALKKTILANVEKNIISNNGNNKSSADDVTVVWTGNGCHVHIPLYWESALENMVEFENFKEQDLATRFIRWAERELSSGLADKHHNPSIKSCLFRVPGTVNNKAKERGRDPIVRFNQVSNWVLVGKQHSASPEDDMSRPRVKPEFLMKFHSMLVQELIDEKVEKMKRRSNLSSGTLVKNNSALVSNKWAFWIEPILKHGWQDHRKDLLYWVLAPYLVTVKGMEYDRAYDLLRVWLQMCDDIRRLEPGWSYFEYRVRYCLDAAKDEKRWPITFESFKEYYSDLYEKLKGSGGSSGD
jgi:hypothetical protein